MQTVEYRASELRAHLADVRGRPVPPRTLRYWRQHLAIVPNQNGRYEQSDLDILSALILAIDNNQTIAQFKARLAEKLNIA